MITEDYVSYEVAKLLKEKGFDEPCRSAYIWNTEEYELCAMFSKPLHFNRGGGLEDYEDDSMPRISAPTHQMAMKWLREVHHIAINIGWGEIFEDQYQWWSIVLNIDSGDILCEYDYHISYEQSCEAAIKNSLEKLI